MYGDTSDNFYGDFFNITSVYLSEYEQQFRKIKIHKGTKQERKNPRSYNACFDFLLGCNLNNVFAHSKLITSDLPGCQRES